MSKHFDHGASYEQAAHDDELLHLTFYGNRPFDPIRYPMWIEDQWHDVTDALMALYHYVLAFAPQEEE